jgi:hypothetical protein
MYTSSIPDLIGYQRAYELWRDAALSFGNDGVSPRYTRNLRSVDVVTTASLATTDTGTKSKTWFTPTAAAAADPAKVSVPPTFNPDGKVPTGSFFGVFGAALLFPTG